MCNSWYVIEYVRVGQLGGWRPGCITRSGCGVVGKCCHHRRDTDRSSGQQTIGDIDDDANVELAEEVLLSVDQSFQRSDTNESGDRPGSIRHAGQRCGVCRERPHGLSTGNRSLPTIRYHDDGEQVGYPGGGVWRMTESGATMSSPPAVNYDQGALSVSIANISGQQIGGKR